MRNAIAWTFAAIVYAFTMAAAFVAVVLTKCWPAILVGGVFWFTVRVLQ